jgi:hypothetical protein
MQCQYPLRELFLLEYFVFLMNLLHRNLSYLAGHKQDLTVVVVVNTIIAVVGIIIINMKI